MLDLAVEIGVAPGFELRRTFTAITGKASVCFVAGATSVMALRQRLPQAITVPKLAL
jgi:hypothetical protein